MLAGKCSRRMCPPSQQHVTRKPSHRSCLGQHPADELTSSVALQHERGARAYIASRR